MVDILSRVLERRPVKDPWTDTLGLRTDPPPFPIKLGQEDCRIKKMLQLIKAGEKIISWKTPRQLESEDNCLETLLGGKDKFKSAMLVGTPELGAQYESDEVYVGLTWLAPGTLYPPHAHDAAEVYQILVGSASWGPTPTYTHVQDPGSFIFHGPGLPHTIQLTGK